MHDFATLETEINERITDILQLKGNAADVIAHDLPFFKKLNLLNIVAHETAPENEKKNIDDIFKAIAAHNNNRILMAHSAFEPAENDLVQFRRTTASNAKIKVLDPLWSKKQFEDAFVKLNETYQKLRALRPSLTYKVIEGRPELIRHYLYAQPHARITSTIFDAATGGGR